MSGDYFKMAALDDLVVIPLRTLQRRMAGNDDVRAIIVAVADGVSTENVQSEIEQLMRERRGKGPSGQLREYVCAS